MKPFDLEAALAGAPVVTRDGRKVEQFTKFDNVDCYMLAGVIEGTRDITTWTIDGNYIEDERGKYSVRNLFMAPNKKEGWMNIYPDGPSYVIFTKKENAKASAHSNSYIVRVEWEE